MSFIKLKITDALIVILWVSPLESFYGGEKRREADLIGTYLTDSNNTSIEFSIF